MFTRRPGSRFNRGRIACARRASFDYGAVSSGTLLADISADFVTQSGTISAFADQSGNSHNFTQGTPAAKPTYEATGWVDGTPSALFDGVDDYVSCTTSLASTLAGGTDTAFTVFAVGRFVVLATGLFVFWNLGNSASATPMFYFGNTSAAGQAEVRKRDDASSNSSLTAAALTTGPAVFEIVHSGTNSILRIDGTQHIDADQDVGATTLDVFGIGALVRNTAAQFCNIRLKRVIAYSGALSDVDATSVRDALAAEHGL